MGDEYPEVQRLGMSGQRPSALEVTSHCTSFTSVTPVTPGRVWPPPDMPGAGPREPSMVPRVNLWGRSARMRRVTIGAMSSPPRRPDDAAGDADVMRPTYVTRGLGGDAPEALGTFDVERPQMAPRTVGSGLTGLEASRSTASASSPVSRLRRYRRRSSRPGR